MSVTLFRSFLRQRFTSPARLILVAMIFLGPLAMLAATHGGLGFQVLGTATMFGFVLGAGMIGSDASSGVFQLLFARPVTRFEYLLSRWLAVAAAATALHAIQVVLGAWIMSSNHALASWGTVGRFLVEQGLETFALAAVIAAFSSVLPGIGDVIAMFATAISIDILIAASQWAKVGFLGGLLREIKITLSPDSSGLFEWSDGGWRVLVTLLSSIAIGLAFAAATLARKEITYAE
jgi:ABC-type transport system involved in multi-copper enzyme maturation permease subunit